MLLKPASEAEVAGSVPAGRAKINEKGLREIAGPFRFFCD